MEAHGARCPRRRRPTALEQYASSLRMEDLEVCEEFFPMYTVPMDVLLCLTRVKPHEEMLEAGSLTIFYETMGAAIFVSHQWLSGHHPDPEGQQMRVLQEAWRNLLSGQSRISTAAVTEVYYGSVPVPTSAELNSEALFVWYDFFSCPQGIDSEAVQRQTHAISSIPSYVARSLYFIILSPALQHETQSQMLSQWTWAQRAWCRAERMSRELSDSKGFVVLVESASHQSLLPGFSGALYSPGEGRFSFEQDRAKVANFIVQLLQRKLQRLLAQGDFHNYRFLLNQQAVRLNKLDAAPIEPDIPGFHTDAAADVVAWFMYQNGLDGINCRDGAGWSPLCYAAVSGNQGLVSALLAMRADANDKIRKGKPDVHLPRNMSVLSLAACFRNNGVMRVLLSAKAHVNATDDRVHSALHWAAVSNNGEAVPLLFAAGINHKIVSFPVCTALQIASATGSPHVIQEILAHVPGHSLEQCLHFSFAVGGGSARLVSLLLEAKANIDEQHAVPANSFNNIFYRTILTIGGIKHRFRTSRLSTLAYHHHGATPLMFSIICGAFEASYALIEAGARLDLRNCRGKTAGDLARELHAPESLLSFLDPDKAQEQEVNCEESEEVINPFNDPTADSSCNCNHPLVAREKEVNCEESEQEMISIYIA